MGPRLGDALLPGKSWATPVPGITVNNDGKTPLYVFPAWNADTHQYDPSLQIPAGSNTVTIADLQAGYYGTAAQSWVRGQTGVGGYDNDPSSPTFNPNPSIEGYSVAYWLMQGASVSQAQSDAAAWAAKLGTKVETVAELGPIGPGDPLYARLQALNALNLATVAPTPETTVVALPGGGAAPVPTASLTPPAADTHPAAPAGPGSTFITAQGPATGTATTAAGTAIEEAGAVASSLPTWAKWVIGLAVGGAVYRALR